MNASRWISLLVAIIYILFFALLLFLAGERGEMSTGKMVIGAICVVLWLSCSLVCIWFGGELGGGMLGAKYGLVSSTSQGWAVKLIGWVLLLLPAGIFIWWSFIR
jgi:hypothetical protein